MVFFNFCFKNLINNSKHYIRSNKQKYAKYTNFSQVNIACQIGVLITIQKKRNVNGVQNIRNKACKQ